MALKTENKQIIIWHNTKMCDQGKVRDLGVVRAGLSEGHIPELGI